MEENAKSTVKSQRDNKICIDIYQRRQITNVSNYSNNPVLRDQVSFKIQPERKKLSIEQTRVYFAAFLQRTIATLPLSLPGGVNQIDFTANLRIKSVAKILVKFLQSYFSVFIDFLSINIIAIIKIDLIKCFIINSYEE